jgi:hypothetical protein
VKELRDPERTLTGAIRVNNGVLPLVSIRGDAPIKKTELKDLVKYLDGAAVDAPVSGGQVLFSGIGKNGVNIIATRSVEEKKKNNNCLTAFFWGGAEKRFCVRVWGKNLWSAGGPDGGPLHGARLPVTGPPPELITEIT